MEPTVSVIMITYNHEAFIKEAIDGVLMQDVNFDVELIIADERWNFAKISINIF